MREIGNKREIADTASPIVALLTPDASPNELSFPSRLTLVGPEKGYVFGIFIFVKRA